MLEVKRVCGVNGGCAQFNLHFQGGKCVPWINRRWMSPTTFNRFSSSFHQNDRTLSGHLILVTDDLENVRQCKNLQTFLIWSTNISKKYSQSQILLTVTGNQKFRRDHISASSRTMTIVFKCASFPPFPDKVENKRNWSLRLLKIFQNVSHIIRVLQLYGKMCEQRGLPTT